MKCLFGTIVAIMVVITGCTGTAPSPAGQQPVEQQITSTAPKIGVAPTSINLEFTEGQTKTSTKTLTIMNEGGGVMIWAARKSQAWLWMAEADGALEKGYSKNLELSFSPSGLSAGTYKDTINIEGVGATNSPQTVQVTMVIKPAPVPTTGSDVKQARKAVPPPPWEYNEWTNDTYKFRIRYPKEYVTKQIGGVPLAAIANSGKPESDIIMVVIEGSYGVDYKDVVTEFSKDAIRQMGGKPNPKIVSNDNATVLADGVTPAFEVVIDSKSSSTASYEVYIFGFQKGNRYIFFGACTPLTYASDRISLWKEIGHTLELTD
jgi:hypothetical protein